MAKPEIWVKKFIGIFKVAISIILAVVILYFVFKNVNWIDFWKKAQDVDYQWIVYSILLSIFAYLLRAYRWNLLLEPMGFKLKTGRTLLAVLIGYLANLALPRLGEITRCGIMNKNDNVPISTALGSVVSERIVDLVSLFILILLGLIFEGRLLLDFLNQSYDSLSIPSYLIWVILFTGLASFATLYYLFIKKGWKEKISGLLKGFIDGLLSIGKMEKVFQFLLSTILLWVIYFLMSFIIVYTLPDTTGLSLTAGLMLLITGGIALTIPVQSGFGTYHGMIAGMLFLYGIDKTTGLFLATLLHTSQIVAVAIFGSIALFVSFFIIKKQDDTNKE